MADITPKPDTFSQRFGSPSGQDRMQLEAMMNQLAPHLGAVNWEGAARPTQGDIRRLMDDPNTITDFISRFGENALPLY